ncbi:hypothetical protein L596_014420 [Steinernema carpocapsae]|uniref:Uncharacterized protein n=1 Tax=Steinernema carpocapsae TaxID=34508 RepID=A0A4U5NCP0_STECR|nr:hypothetical protein L596_014420 [Steinernema carpocapsae]
MKDETEKTLDFHDVRQKYQKVSLLLTLIFFVAFGFATTTTTTSKEKSVLALNNYGFARAKRSFHPVSFTDIQPLRHFLPQKSLRGHVHFGVPQTTVASTNPCSRYEAKYGSGFSRQSTFTVISWFPFCPFFILTLFLIAYSVFIFLKPRFLLSTKAKALRAMVHGGFALGSLEILVPLNIDSSDRTSAVPKWQIFVASSLALLFFVLQTMLVVGAYVINVDEQQSSRDDELKKEGFTFKRPFNLFFYIALLTILLTAFILSSVHNPEGIVVGLKKEAIHTIVWFYTENFCWRSFVPFAILFVIAVTVYLMIFCARKSGEFHIHKWLCINLATAKFSAVPRRLKTDPRPLQTRGAPTVSPNLVISTLFLHFVSCCVLFLICCIDGYYYFADMVPNKHCALIKPLRSAIFDSFVILTICCGLYVLVSVGLVIEFYGKLRRKPNRKSAIVTRF